MPSVIPCRAQQRASGTHPGWGAPNNPFLRMLHASTGLRRVHCLDARVQPSYLGRQTAPPPIRVLHEMIFIRVVLFFLLFKIYDDRSIVFFRTRTWKMILKLELEIRNFRKIRTSSRFCCSWSLIESRIDRMMERIIRLFLFKSYSIIVLTRYIHSIRIFSFLLQVCSKSDLEQHLCNEITY